jgi:succinate-semialdehyde dehydrogenase/glutarate-semialdehyde dehydrogenase
MPQEPSEHLFDHTVGHPPYRDEILKHSPQTPVNALKDIIETARDIQPSWARLPIRERVGHMLRVRNYIAQNAEEIAEVISKDNGKTRIDAMSTDVMPAVMGIDYYAKHAKKFLKDKAVPPGNILLLNKRSKIIRVPFGVIGVISPWNYPFHIPLGEIVPGLLAGNAVVFKAATQTQMVGRIIEKCIQAAKLPDGIFNYVNIPGRLVGSALLKNGVDKLFYTGSLAVGKKLMKEASETLTPLVLELGGNDAMLVCEDADLYRAASGAAWAGLSNCGQSCGGVERIYVHEKVYDPFLLQLKEKVEALRVGIDQDFNVDMGEMTTQRTMNDVKRHLEDALSKGAVIYAQTGDRQGRDSGRIMPGYVLTEVHHDMLVIKEETFGPILCVMKVKDMDEAITLANDSDLGLSGSVWAKNTKKAETLARKIQAGAVTINDHLMSHGLPETPWGGFKTSGIGRVHGENGFDEFTQPQVIVHDILPFARQNMWWFPHGKKIYQGLSGAIKLLYERSVYLRVKGMLDLLKILPRYFTTR